MRFALGVFALAVIGGYVALVRWQMSRSIAQRYNSVVARFLPQNTVMTLWRTIYLKDVRQVVSGAKLVHEMHHINAQWARWPYTFLFRYLVDVALHGYDGSHFENEARRAAGQPER